METIMEPNPSMRISDTRLSGSSTCKLPLLAHKVAEGSTIVTIVERYEALIVTMV